MISERLANARRLELTDAVESGDHIEGHFRGVKVVLEDHGLERTLQFDFGRAVKWVSIAPRGAEINDPDVVVTGEAAFDEAITVLAEDGHAPSVRGVVSDPAVRALISEFFRKFPLAAFKGRTLTLPHVATADTTAALQLGAKLVLLLREAADRVPDIAPEQPPVLQTTWEGQHDHPDRPDLRPLGSNLPAVRTQFLSLAALGIGAGTLLIFGNHFWGIVIAGVLAIGGLIAWPGRLR